MPDRSLFCGVAPSGLILRSAFWWPQKESQRADDLQERGQPAARLPRQSQQRVATRAALEGTGSSRRCRLLTAGARAGPFELATNQRASVLFGELPASLFNHCLVYEHNWNIVAYGVYAFALGALESAAVGLQFDLHLADWTGEYLEKSLAYRHLSPPFVELKSNTPILRASIFGFSRTHSLFTQTLSG